MLSLEYLAGIIDGEGWIGFNLGNKDNHLRIRIEVQMTHFGVLELIQSQFGGKIRYRKFVTGNRQPIAVWVVSNNKAIIILVQIYPFLIVKRNQATLALQFYKYQCANKYKPLPEANNFFKTKMHELNRRGRNETKSEE